MHTLSGQHKREAEAIARSLPPEARVALLSIMGEIVNTLTNFDVSCPHQAVYCRQLIRLERARLLLDALNRVHAQAEQLAADRDSVDTR